MVKTYDNPLQSEIQGPGDSEYIRKHAALAFTGNGFEYFKIWIVNVALTILTLGIYSAWAKVRRKQYFYGNTVLEGSAFEYSADPVLILKGRIIAFVLFMAFIFIVNSYPLAEPFLWLFFLPFLPWILIKALKFNAKYSAYRHIHFNFKATYKDALFVFVIIPLSLLFTLGLTYPWFVYRQRKFIVNHHYYGQSSFLFDAKTSEFYKIYGLALLILVGAGVLMSVAYNFLDPASLATAVSGESSDLSQAPIFGLAVMAFMIPVYLALFAFIHTRIQNLVWSRTRLAEIGFRSSMRVAGILWLYISNSIGIILTAGLFIPWAQIRMVRYRLEHLTLLTKQSMDKFSAGEKEKIGATGEEVGEFFDVDVSF